MSVIVMGMEMPHKCLECQLNTDEIICTAATLEQSKEAYYEAKKNGTSHEEEMFKICPLRPLPEKHGRIVDVGPLEVVAYNTKEHEEDDFDDGAVFILEKLDALPTIVEAEGE